MERLNLFDVIKVEDEKFLFSNLLEQSKFYHLSNDFRDLLDFANHALLIRYFSWP